MKAAPILLAILAASLVTGQQKEYLRFEVTSVKPSDPDFRLRRHDFGCADGRFRSFGTGPCEGYCGPGVLNAEKTTDWWGFPNGYSAQTLLSISKHEPTP